MAMLKSLFYLLVMLVFIIVGLIFLFRNQSLINVDFLILQSSNLSIGFWLLVSLLVGVVLGMMLVLPARFLQKRKIHQLSKKIKNNKMPQTHIKVESTKGA